MYTTCSRKHCETVTFEVPSRQVAVQQNEELNLNSTVNIIMGTSQTQASSLLCKKAIPISNPLGGDSLTFLWRFQDLGLTACPTIFTPQQSGGHRARDQPRTVSTTLQCKQNKGEKNSHMHHCHYPRRN